MAGPPKTFKSSLAHDLAISVASGTPFLNHFPVDTQGPVIMLPREDKDWVTLERAWGIEASKGLVPNTLWANERYLEHELPLHVLNQERTLRV